MTNQEQWTPGTTPSDAKLGTDDPAEERENLQGQVQGDGGTSDDDDQPDDTGADGTLGDRDLPA